MNHLLPFCLSVAERQCDVAFSRAHLPERRKGMDWTQIVITAVGLLFSAVVIPLVKAAFAWIKEKTQNEALFAALDEAQTVADQVVAGLNATVVEGLKAKNADGKLSIGEAKEVAQKALGMFLSDLSARSIAVLENNADDIAAYVGNLLEARLLSLKGGK